MKTAYLQLLLYKYIDRYNLVLTSGRGFRLTRFSFCNVHKTLANLFCNEQAPMSDSEQFIAFIFIP